MTVTLPIRAAFADREKIVKVWSVVVAVAAADSKMVSADSKMVSANSNMVSADSKMFPLSELLLMAC